MKLALYMILCSTLAGECMPPHLFSTHDNYYECMIAGYEEAKNKTQELGREEINKYGVYIKFVCSYKQPAEEKIEKLT